MEVPYHPNVAYFYADPRPSERKQTVEVRSGIYPDIAKGVRIIFKWMDSHGELHEPSYFRSLVEDSIALGDPYMPFRVEIELTSGPMPTEYPSDAPTVVNPPCTPAPQGPGDPAPQPNWIQRMRKADSYYIGGKKK